MITPETVIFHVDMDAFYASIEQRDNPRYLHKPVIIGARPGHRGVVSTCSYEARKFGIHSAMPISQAYARCPQGIYIPPRMVYYIEVSEQIMGIFRQFTPDVESLSIDEAFLDMSGTGGLWGSPLNAALRLSKEIKDKVQLSASIGIAPNKFLAKLASDMDKPNGITQVPFEQEEIMKWLAPLNISRIWGIGPRSCDHLQQMGVRIISDLQNMSLDQLHTTFGKNGISLYYLSRGIDKRQVGDTHAIKSVSREHTFSSDTADRELINKTLLTLAQDVAGRCRKNGHKGRTLYLTWRTSDFQRRTRRVTLDNATHLARTIFNTAGRLAREAISPQTKIRLIGLGVSGLEFSSQQNFMDILDGTMPIEKSEKAMDSIKTKFGNNAIFFAGEMKRKK